MGYPRYVVHYEWEDGSYSRPGGQASTLPEANRLFAQAVADTRNKTYEGGVFGRGVSLTQLDPQTGEELKVLKRSNPGPATANARFQSLIKKLDQAFGSENVSSRDTNWYGVGSAYIEVTVPSDSEYADPSVTVRLSDHAAPQYGGLRYSESTGSTERLGEAEVSIYPGSPTSLSNVVETVWKAAKKQLSEGENFLSKQNPGFLDRFSKSVVTPSHAKVASLKKRAFGSGQFDSMGGGGGGNQWAKYPGLMQGWPEKAQDEVEKAYEKGRLRGMKAEYGDFYQENPRKPRMMDEYMNETISWGGVTLPRWEAAELAEELYDDPKQRKYVLDHQIWLPAGVSAPPWTVGGHPVSRQEVLKLLRWAVENPRMRSELSENPADHYRAGYKRGQEFKTKHGNWSLEGAKYDFNDLQRKYENKFEYPERSDAGIEYYHGLEDGFYGELRKYAAFQWQGAGMYRPESAVGPVFDSETKARRYADRMNETEEAKRLPGGGYVVRQANRANPSIYDYEDAWRAGQERGKQFMERSGVSPSQLHPSEFSQAFNVWWKNEKPVGVTPADVAGNRRAFIRGFKEVGRERRTA